MRARSSFARQDWLLTGAALYLSALGVLFIYSASYQAYPDRPEADPDAPARAVSQFARKQAVWVAAGLAAGLVAMRAHPSRWHGWATVLYLASAAGLIGVQLFGVDIKGSRRWFDLGPANVQPSEFAKIAAVLALAACLGDGSRLRAWRGWVLPLALVLLPTLLVLRQPDLGTAMLFPMVGAAMIFCAGADLKRFGTLAAAGVALAALAWTLPPPAGLRPYQRARLTAFAKVWSAQEGDLPARDLQLDLWQLDQAQIAIGSGGIVGRGFLNGTQNRFSFVPESANDFIFSVVGEEWGFVGCLSALAAYAAIYWAIGGIAVRAKDPFARNVAVGVGVLIACQAFINPAMTMAMFPITGMTLPFVSYGGSSAVVVWICIGLLQGIATRQQPGG